MFLFLKLQDWKIFDETVLCGFIILIVCFWNLWDASLICSETVRTLLQVCEQEQKNMLLHQ
jgi:hypothetical protein